MVSRRKGKRKVSPTLKIGDYVEIIHDSEFPDWNGRIGKIIRESPDKYYITIIIPERLKHMVLDYPIYKEKDVVRKLSKDEVMVELL